jgi:O-antigen/teichoic acid export membrane protein
MASEERALISSGLWSLAVRLLGMVASFGGGVYLARFLNPVGLGAYGITIAIALLLSVLAQFGLQTVAVREISVALSREQWGAVRGYIRTFTRVVSTVSVCLAALWSIAAFTRPKLLGSESLNLFGALLVPLYALTVLLNAQLRALGRIVSGQLLELLIRPALMGALLGAMYLAHSVLTPAFAVTLQVAASAMTLAVGLVWLRSATPPDARRAVPVRPRPWAKSASTLAALDLLRQLDVSYGILLLGLLSSAAEAGYFRVALSTVIFVATPLSIFTVVFAPTLARLHSSAEKERLQRLMSVSAAIMFGISVGALLVIAIFGRQLIAYVFGPAYVSSWGPLLLLSLAQAINGFFGIGWVLLSMSGGERVLAKSFAVSVCISVAAAVPLTLRGGAEGAGSAAVIGALVQNVLAWRGVRKHASLESSVVGLVWHFIPRATKRVAR